jgi:DNA-directed RNA polymerases I, II, and III subunit RPABC2
VSEAQKELDRMETSDDGRKIVQAGDVSAAAIRGQSGAAPKDKKIPTDQRNTTPYMTKYERARVLGTRALQIRYESLEAVDFARSMLTGPPIA